MVASNTASTMASQAVFNITELMEAVLTLLPLPSLLRAQLVCKQWQRVIQNSSVLQQDLFLQPAKDELVWLVDIVNLPAQQRPLRRDFKSHLRVIAAISRNSEDLRRHFGLVVTPVRLHPLIFRQSRSISGNIDLKVDRPDELTLSISFNQLKELEHHTLQYMFLTQPPVRNISIEVFLDYREPRLQNFSFDRRTDAVAAKIFDEGGVRVGQVVAEVAKMAVLGDALDTIVIQMHGVVEATEENEEVVRERSKQWRDARRVSESQ